MSNARQLSAWQPVRRCSAARCSAPVMILARLRQPSVDPCGVGNLRTAVGSDLRGQGRRPWRKRCRRAAASTFIRLVDHRGRPIARSSGPGVPVAQAVAWRSDWSGCWRRQNCGSRKVAWKWLLIGASLRRLPQPWSTDNSSTVLHRGADQRPSAEWLMRVVTRPGPPIGFQFRRCPGAFVGACIGALVGGQLEARGLSRRLQHAPLHRRRHADGLRCHVGGRPLRRGWHQRGRVLADGLGGAGRCGSGVDPPTDW